MISSNGTFVNGKRVGKSNKIILKNGDEMSLVSRRGSNDCIMTYIFQDLSVEVRNGSAEQVSLIEYR